MEQGVWQEIEQLYQKFQKLGISEAVDLLLHFFGSSDISSDSDIKQKTAV